jgi:hypothetical protein
LFLDGAAEVSSYLGAISEAFRWPIRDEQDPEIHTGALPRATNGRNLGHLSCHEDSAENLTALATAPATSVKADTLFCAYQLLVECASC